MGLPRFKGRIGWVTKVYGKDRMGLSRFKRRVGLVYQGLREE